MREPHCMQAPCPIETDSSLQPAHLMGTKQPGRHRSGSRGDRTYTKHVGQKHSCFARSPLVDAESSTLKGIFPASLPTSHLHDAQDGRLVFVWVGRLGISTPRSPSLRRPGRG